ncbi:hypothetical protein HAHI6034_01915 [Hathewaya histolytica]|uniref:Uncharacterized protein n=1 Tax=Hathewaya histolytica TaxID=1498 RepID=A0A4U9R013_HATHI|nr:hypothetical protein [Hathewaya histolytica]VTQ84462.1 Uncharacterised protein [Hathewaya histolytica]
MTISNIISFISFTLLAILILKDYIAIRKPYNYLTIIFVILPPMIINTPIGKNMSRGLERIFVPAYAAIGIGIIVCHEYTRRKKK